MLWAAGECPSTEDNPLTVLRVAVSNECVCGGFTLAGLQLPAQLLSDSLSSSGQREEMRKKLMGQGKDRQITSQLVSPSRLDLGPHS